MAKQYRVLTAESVASTPMGFQTTQALEVEQMEKNLANVSDAEIIARLRERFSVLDDMTRAVKKGSVRAMIVSGPPGVGKSFGVEAVLSKHELMANVAGDSKLKKFEIVKGTMSAIGLYKKLFEYSDKKSIVVFDDCDSVLVDEISLGILKGALDSSKKRVISWNTDTHSLDREGVPNSFEFQGGAIFITNIKFENVKSRKLKDHLAALESRCHYLDLTIDTDREKILRIEQIIADGMLDEYDFTEEEVAEIVDFVKTNQKRLRELSLRMITKISELKKSFPSTWKNVAGMTVMRR